MRLTFFSLMGILLLSACTRPASTTSPIISAVTTQEQIQPPSPGVESPSSPDESGQPATGASPDSLGSPEVPPTEIPAPIEVPVTRIPLGGPISASNAEISSMAWYQDRLILLPQYPGRFQGGDQGALFALTRNEITAFLAGEIPGPLEPQPVPFYAPDLQDNIDGFEGFEAIAFYGDRIYLTIESRPNGMVGYLVMGSITPDLSQVIVNRYSLAQIPPQTDILNLSDESIIVFGDRLVTLYEANGRSVNAHPIAHMFNLDLQLQDTLAFPNIDYRITDTTPADELGQFWAINYFFPGDTWLETETDSLARVFGQGATHAGNLTVERLVEFQFSEAGIVFADTPPIQIELLGDAYSRNWEAIARLDDRGFLLATDKFPETVFGFVPFP